MKTINKDDLIDINLELISASFRDMSLQMTERKMKIEKNRAELEKIVAKYDVKDKNKTYNPEDVKSDIARAEKLFEKSSKLLKEFEVLFVEYNRTFVDDIGFYEIDLKNIKKDLNFMTFYLKNFKKNFSSLIEIEKE